MMNDLVLRVLLLLLVFSFTTFISSLFFFNFVILIHSDDDQTKQKKIQKANCPSNCNHLESMNDNSPLTVASLFQCELKSALLPILLLTTVLLARTVQ